MDKNMYLAYQLMEAIRQTDEWECIWMEYPGVVEAKAKLDAVMERVDAQIPTELVNELWEAFGELDWANECACVLFGFRLFHSITRAAADPAGFSSYARQKKEDGSNVKSH